jgi:uncharacterized protein YbcI
VCDTRGWPSPTRCEPGFAEEVERIVGRRVLGFTSQILVTRDVVIEMFVLEPVSSRPEA